MADLNFDENDTANPNGPINLCVNGASPMTPKPLHTGIRVAALKAILRAPEDLAYPFATDHQNRPVTVDVISAQPPSISSSLEPRLT